jgi:hypothetical protein
VEENRPSIAQDEPESGPSKIWFWCRVVWTIFSNLVYIALVVFAFDKAQSAFETLTLSLLILIYQAVNWSSTARIRTDVEEALVQRRMLFAILQKLGEDTTEAEDFIRDAERKYLRSNPIYYINMAGASLVYFLILWKILRTIF